MHRGQVCTRNGFGVCWYWYIRSDVGRLGTGPAAPVLAGPIFQAPTMQYIFN